MNKWVATIAVAASMMAAAPASAAIYIIDFTLIGTGSGTATLTTASDATAGFSLVTALTGSFNSNPISLLAPGSYPLPVANANDNLFRATAPFFDFNGLSFSSNGTNYNLYADTGTNLFCASTGTTCGINDQTGNATITLRDGAVPEPATWAMMLIGFGAIGFAARRARKAGAVKVRA